MWTLSRCVFPKYCPTAPVYITCPCLCPADPCPLYVQRSSPPGPNYLCILFSSDISGRWPSCPLHRPCRISLLKAVRPAAFLREYRTPIIPIPPKGQQPRAPSPVI